MSETPQITLREARDYQNHVLAEMVSFVPVEAVTGGMDRPIAQISVMSCNWEEGAGASWEKTGVFLPGGYDVEVALNTELDAVLDDVAAKYMKLQGWTVGSKGEGGERVLEVTSPDGYDFYVEYYPVSDAALQFSVSSFSPCIEAPEGFDPFGEY